MYAGVCASRQAESFIKRHVEWGKYRDEIDKKLLFFPNQRGKSLRCAGEEVVKGGKEKRVWGGASI